MSVAAGTRPQSNTRTPLDLRHISEQDRDYQRMHARTTRLLTASLRQLVRALRHSGSHDSETPILSAFIMRHTGLLRQAYTAAHGEGVRDYYDGVSRQPQHWAKALGEPPSDTTLVRRLSFYAPSVARMAHEALLAWHEEKRPQVLREAEAIAARAFTATDTRTNESTEESIALSGHQPGYTQNRGPHGKWGPGDGGSAGAGGLRGRLAALVAHLQGHKAGASAAATAHSTVLGEGAHVDWGEHEQGGRAALRAMFGRDLADHEVAALVGARPGDTVRIGRVYQNGAYAAVSLKLRGKDGAYDADRGVETHLDKHGKLNGVKMENALIQVYDSGKGIGTELFARQVAALRDLGVSEIETRAERGGYQGVGIHGRSAVRNEAFNGYYTWARLGYNADLRGHEFQSYGYRERMPGWVKAAHTIHDLMRIPASEGHESGAHWWQEHGKGWNARFDLTPNSRSIQVLREYLHEKGKTIPGVELAEPHGAEEIEWTAEDEAAADRAWETLNRRWAAEDRSQHLSESITLADEPPLDTWLNGTAPRVNLQAEITWSGFNDGYVDGGATDTANPYLLVWWDLDLAAKHCDSCPQYAEMSPYDPPWVQGGNQLNATPGDGHTECGAACKCSLRYGGQEEGAGGPDPRGDVWDSPNAPPAPPGPDGQPGKWPNIAAVDDIAELPTAQQEALQAGLDAYRSAAARWEAIRGALPSLPNMFAASDASNWPAWEALSPAQQVALRAVFEAMASYDVVAGSPTQDELAAATAGDEAALASLQSQLEGMADHLDDFVSELNQAADQDWQDLFNKGPWKMFWWQLQQDFEAVLDWFYNRTPPKLSEPAAGPVQLSGHEPGYNAQGHGAHGHWLPGEGSEAEGGGSGGSARQQGGFSKSLRRRGHPPNTPEQREAAKERNRVRVAARAAKARAAKLAAMTEEERAAYLKRSEQVAAGRARTPEERAAHRQEWYRAQQNAYREADRQAYLSPEERAVPVPHVKAETPEAGRLVRAYQQQLKVARALYAARMEREHADARARVTELRAQHTVVRAKLAATTHEAERATLREHLRTLVAEHNKLVTWIKENPIPTELREPLDSLDDVILLGGHQPGYQQNRGPGGKFGPGNGPSEEEGGSGRQRAVTPTTRMPRAPKLPAYKHVARDAEGNPIKGGTRAKGEPKGKGKTKPEATGRYGDPKVTISAGKVTVEGATLRGAHGKSIVEADHEHGGYKVTRPDGSVMHGASASLVNTHLLGTFGKSSFNKSQLEPGAKKSAATKVETRAAKAATSKAPKESTEPSASKTPKAAAKPLTDEQRAARADARAASAQQEFNHAVENYRQSMGMAGMGHISAATAREDMAGSAVGQKLRAAKFEAEMAHSALDHAGQTRQWEGNESTHPPFSVHDFESASFKAAQGGINSDAFTAKIGEKSYFVKRVTDEGTFGQHAGDAEREARAEALSTQVSRELGNGEHVTPTYAFGINGHAYVASEQVNAKAVGWTASSGKALMKVLGEDGAASVWLDQYVRGDLDRNGGNTLINAKTGKVFEIDSARSFNTTSALPQNTSGPLHLAWERASNGGKLVSPLRQDHNPRAITARHAKAWEKMAIPHHVLARVMRAEPEVVDTLRRGGVREDEIERVQKRFAILRQVSQTASPSVGSIEAAAMASIHGGGA